MESLAGASTPTIAWSRASAFYASTARENHWTMACRCMSVACRSVIGDFHLLPHQLRRRYIGLGIVQRFIAQEWESRGGLPARHDTWPAAQARQA